MVENPVLRGSIVGIIVRSSMVTGIYLIGTFIMSPHLSFSHTKSLLYPSLITFLCPYTL
jgi:hypothetical protein